MFGQIFLICFKWISLFCYFHWVDQLGIGLGLVLWGYTVAFFSILSVQKIGIFLGFSDFGASFWGGMCGGTILDLVPSLWGDIDLRVRA